MIHYQLRCAHDHQFDGWFKNSAGFEDQAARGLVSCPQCGDTKVNRALMAPAVPKKGAPAAPGRGASAKVDAASAPTVDQSGTPVARPAPPAMSGPLPDHLRAMLQRLRTEVEKHCDNVGNQFAEEARRIHRGESERRGIYGDTTPEQAEALADEGIEVARIPWLPRADS